jgi:threonine dehydratase
MGAGIYWRHSGDESVKGVVFLTDPRELPINPPLEEVLRAASFLEGKIRRTPAEFSPCLSESTGSPIFVKWECLQRCGAFKIRGAFWKMHCLTEEQRAKGVVTCSSGNHGQGIALAAMEMGIRAVIFVPEACPETKRAAIRRLGGDRVELKVSGRLYDDAEAAAHRYAEAAGATYVSSFEDSHVVAGAGTLGFEFLSQCPDLDLLIVPAGGGGLINGVALAAKALRPSIEIWGVQSEASNPYVVSWGDGIVREVEYGDSLADGLTGWIPQSLLSLAKTRVTGMVQVTEEAVGRAMAYACTKCRVVVEGAGAVGLAALLSGVIRPEGRRTGVVISGGNLDSGILTDLIRRYGTGY